MEHETEQESSLRWFAMRVRRHLEWGRRQGFRRLIEEDDLNPARRAHLALRKWRYRRAHDIPPNAVPVYVVGVQRSGTNMLVRGLEESPEFELRNENDGGAFERFRLRPDPVIRELVARSGHRYVLFKPLAESHRTAELLDGLGTPSHGRAIWAYRSVDGRVRSALAKFGSNNLEVLRELASGRGRGRDRWQAQGLSDESLALIESFDYERMSPESAAALFWYVRNALFFEQGLDRRDDVTIASYDAFLAEPERSMRTLCAFLDFDYDPRLVAHMAPRGGSPPPLALDPRIRERCDELGARLDAAVAEEQRRRLGETVSAG